MNGRMFAATTKGWHQVCLDTGRIVCSARERQLVSTIAVDNGYILAACPELAEVHSMMSWWDGTTPQVSFLPRLWLN